MATNLVGHTTEVCRTRFALLLHDNKTSWGDKSCHGKIKVEVDDNVV